MTIDLPLLLRVAGVMHLGLLSAGLLMPKIVNMRVHLGGLPAFIRRLFWVYYSFIGLCLVSFGVLTIVFAQALSSGSTLARPLCTFFAVFWTVRLLVAMFVFDMRPYLTTTARRVGYHALNVVFAYLPLVYAFAAIRPV